MAHDVFVSYSNIDKTVADAVVAGLESESIRCWMAPRDITPGESWGDAIVEAITESKAMVLVLSANSNDSRQVIREVERAVANGVMILPFRIQEIDPTGAMAYFLGTEHWLDALTPPLERHIERLGSTLTRVLSGEPGTGRIDQPPRAVVRRHRPPAWALVLGGLAVVLAAVLGANVLSGGSESTAPVQGDSGAEQPVGTSPSSAPASTTTEAPAPTLGPFVEVATYPTSRALNGFDIEGNFLVLANGDDGLMHMSVGDPANPLPMAEYSLSGATDAALGDGFVFAIGGDGHDLVFISVDLDGSGGYFLPEDQSHTSSIYNVVLSGDYVYLTGHDFVGIIDVADPKTPVLLSSWEPDGSTGNPADVFIDGDIGYFAAGWDGLYVMDLTDPAQPVEIGRFDSPNWIIDLVVADGIVYMTLGEGGLATVDVTDPTRPLLMDIVDLPAFASPLAVADGFAYAGVLDDGGPETSVAVVDIADPEALELVATVGDYQLVSDLEVASGHLFVADESRGLFVYEIPG